MHEHHTTSTIERNDSTHTAEDIHAFHSHDALDHDCDHTHPGECSTVCGCSHEHATMHADDLFARSEPAHGELGHACTTHCETHHHDANTMAKSLFDVLPKHGEIGHSCHTECETHAADVVADDLFNKSGEGSIPDVRESGTNVVASRSSATRNADETFLRRPDTPTPTNVQKLSKPRDPKISKKQVDKDQSRSYKPTHAAKLPSQAVASTRPLPLKKLSTSAEVPPLPVPQSMPTIESAPFIEQSVAMSKSSLPDPETDTQGAQEPILLSKHSAESIPSTSGETAPSLHKKNDTHPTITPTTAFESSYPEPSEKSAMNTPSEHEAASHTADTALLPSIESSVPSYVPVLRGDIATTPMHETLDVLDTPTAAIEAPPSIEQIITEPSEPILDFAPQLLPDTQRGVDLPPDHSILHAEASGTQEIDQKYYPVLSEFEQSTTDRKVEYTEPTLAPSPEVTHIISHLISLLQTAAHPNDIRDITVLLANHLNMSPEQVRTALRLTPDYLPSESSIEIASHALRRGFSTQAQSSKSSQKRLSLYQRLKKQLTKRWQRTWKRINYTLPLADIAKLY